MSPSATVHRYKWGLLLVVIIKFLHGFFWSFVTAPTHWPCNAKWASTVISIHSESQQVGTERMSEQVSSLPPCGQGSQGPRRVCFVHIIEPGEHEAVMPWTQVSWLQGKYPLPSFQVHIQTSSESSSYSPWTISKILPDMCGLWSSSLGL